MLHPLNYEVTSTIECDSDAELATSLPVGEKRLLEPDADWEVQTLRANTSTDIDTSGYESFAFQLHPDAGGECTVETSQEEPFSRGPDWSIDFTVTEWTVFAVSAPRP